ncbi:MAG: 7-carboxy-7-deazaguanine synthase QueE [Pseudomonadota bacterium]
MLNVARDDLPATERLRITEIFHSLQGEALTAGLPTVFVRLTGCPLRCRYCDTAYAFHGGDWHSYDDILARIAAFGAQHVCVTGGEPLAQANCIGLLSRLCDAGYAVSLETSGALDISAVDGRVSRVLDLKTPASGESERNVWSNVSVLNAHDQIKFVVCDRADFDWAVDKITAFDMIARCTVWISPEHDKVALPEIADWILESNLPLRLQVQLHKFIWGDQPGR